MGGSAADSMVDDLHVLLARTIDLVLEVTGTDAAWNMPSRYSQAGTELIAEESRRPDPLMGSWPWLMAPMAARWALCLAVEEATGFRGVLNAETTSYAADVLCRAVLESSSLAWWLLDPTIDSEKRLARSLLYRYCTARQTKSAIGHLGLGPEEDQSEYGELPEEVRDEVRNLGLTWTEARGRQGPACEEESWPSRTDRVAELVRHFWPQPKLPYAVLCAVSHAELLGLTRSLTRLSGKTQRLPSVEATSSWPVTDPTGVWLWHDAYLVLGALVFSAERAATFLDAKHHVSALQALKTELDHALPALRPHLP